MQTPRQAESRLCSGCVPVRRTLSHVHLHNNDGVRDLHAPLDQGAMDIAGLLTELSALCPRATVTLELGTCRQSVEWLAAQNLLEE